MGVWQYGPTGLHDFNNSVKVIRHDDVLIELDIGTNDRRPLPLGTYQLAKFVEAYIAANNSTKQSDAIVDTDCDEISSATCVVVVRQSNRPALSIESAIGHRPSPL